MCECTEKINHGAELLKILLLWMFAKLKTQNGRLEEIEK
jgi:hypothetical protein